MIVYSRVVLDMTAPGCPVVERVVWNPDYRGPVAVCKTSDAEKAAAAQTQALSKTMMNYYQTNYAGQQGIIDSLKSSVENLVAAGPSQYGFTAAEDAALRTQASAGTANAYKMASQARGEQLAAVGGGNAFLPSGTKENLMNQTALAAAQRESEQQLGITEAGFAQGRQNWETGLKQETELGQLEDPSSFGGQASSTSQAAFGQDRAMANDPGTLGIVGGILGGIGASFAQGAGSGMTCPAIGSMIKLCGEPDAAVETLKVGDLIMGIDGHPDEITIIRATPVQPVWKVDTLNRSVLVSGTHCFCHPRGSYVYAYECAETEVLLEDGTGFATAVQHGASICYQIETKRTHSYCVESFWSLT